MDEEQNRMLRRTGVTAREAMAIAGLTSWTTLLDIYRAKVDDIALPPEPTTDVEMLMAWYKRETGTSRLDRLPMARSARLRFALSDPIHLSVPGDRLVRFRTASKSKLWGSAGGQMVPEDLYNECQWDLGVLGKEEADIAVRFVGGSISLYTVKAVPEIFDGYYAIAEHFMANHCMPAVPPPTAADIVAQMVVDLAGKS